mmetsp:Transcript_105861/g.341443  ORF Transcript_105861/g.341443 Transcript_105861/m.341443 type:complete len:206 (+) Transcript_105861:96-713(+)
MPCKYSVLSASPMADGQLIYSSRCADRGASTPPPVQRLAASLCLQQLSEERPVLPSLKCFVLLDWDVQTCIMFERRVGGLPSLRRDLALKAFAGLRPWEWRLLRNACPPLRLIVRSTDDALLGLLPKEWFHAFERLRRFIVGAAERGGRSVGSWPCCRQTRNTCSCCMLCAGVVMLRLAGCCFASVLTPTCRTRPVCAHCTSQRG